MRIEELKGISKEPEKSGEQGEAPRGNTGSRQRWTIFPSAAPTVGRPRFFYYLNPRRDERIIGIV